MKTLLLIDTNALVHRSFHALPPFKSADNKPTGALYGVASILIKTLQAPADFIASLFDRAEPTFRKKIFEEYKIHRPQAPDDLIFQIKETRNLVNHFGIKTFEHSGFEADDLIGSFVKKFKNTPDLKIKILSGDLDTLQLVEDDKIVVDFLKTGISETKIYDEKAVIERYGIFPNQIPDFKGIAGDASDNIPGVKGVGPKTATPLLVRFGSLENLFKEAEAGNLDLNKEKAVKKILENKKDALLSRDLARIVCDAPIEIKDINELAFKGFPKEELKDYLKNFGFKSLIERIDKFY